MSSLLPMFLFALAASLSPGPVNLVGLGTGAQRGLRAGLRHVSGATCGFTLLLVLCGFGLRELLAVAPWLLGGIRVAGTLWFAWMAVKLWRDAGRLSAAGAGEGSLFWQGALMQWLNPKAWIASAAGMGAFAAEGGSGRIGLFALIYFVVCYASLACWVLAGWRLRRWVEAPQRIRLLNRLLAAMLLSCAPAMWFT